MANQTLETLHGVLYGNGLRIGTLSGSARTFAMLLGRRSDVIPFMGPQIHDHAMTVAGVPAYKYYFDAELLVDVQIAVERWYGFDTYTIIPDAYNFEVEALGAKMIYSDFAMPTVDRNQPLIQGPDDLARLRPLDPSKGRIPMGVEAARLISERASGPFAMGFFCSPFSFLIQASDYTTVIRALKKDKAFAQDLFDFAENQAIFPYLQAQAEAGVKQSAGADAWAAFPHLTPDLAQEWVIPSAERLAARAKKELGLTAMAGLAACDYCEENPEKFDKDLMYRCWDIGRQTFMIDVAVSAMGRTQDWTMQWLQDYAKEHGRFGRKLPVFASLNARFMRDSSPQTIVEKIREWIDVLGRDGRVLFFIGNVPADTPPINVHTAVHAVHTLGRYPIADDLSSVEIDPPDFKPFDDWLVHQPEAETIYEGREPGPRPKVFSA